MKPVEFNFKTFVRNQKPNSYLVCPKNYCHTKIDMASPEYHVDLPTLEAAWIKMIAKQPRTKLVYHAANTHQYQYVQRSLIFRFPDYINVLFIPLSNNRSTIAIYSHSVYGYSDLGVNKKRVENWLAELGLNLAE